jgi:hypothetical protein
MTGEHIHVTRWDNTHQEFVDVGMLCESDGLEKPFPIVSFTYTDGYLDKYSPLYPKKMQRTDSSTLINDADFNASLPKAFTPYLPNNTMKNALSHLINDFDDMTPFQQLKSVADIKGDFGSVQLNYNNEVQNNMLPHSIEQASRLLDIMRNRDYKLLSVADVNAIYDYDIHNLSVRMVRLVSDDLFNIATVSEAKSQADAKQAIVVQGVMASAGIDVLEVYIEKHADKYFIVQHDPTEKISKNHGQTVIEDSIHIHPLLHSTKFISDEANLCAAELSNLCNSIGGKGAAKEIYARSIVAQVMNQRDFNVNQVKFKEVGGSWRLSPQKINPIYPDDKSPFQLPLVSGQSTYVKYAFKETASPLLARTFGISSRQQDKILDEINDAFSSVVAIAEAKGISSEHSNPIKKIHEISGLFKVTSDSIKPADESFPNMDQ